MHSRETLLTHVGFRSKFFQNVVTDETCWRALRARVERCYGCDETWPLSRDAKSRHIAMSNEGQGGFTTDPNATSRTSMTVEVDGLLLDSAGHADLSSNVYFDAVDRAHVAVTDKSQAASAMDGEIDVVSAGANPLVPFAPDIDTSLRFSYELKPGALELQGNVWGDRFPNAELLVADHSGATVTLGDFQTKGGAKLGVFSLVGDAPRTPAFDLVPFHAEIPLDADGDFAGSPLVRAR